MSVVAIMQARLGSTRLPAKILEPLLGRPVLWWDMHRLQKARYLDRIVVATTVSPADQAVVDLCQEHGWLWVRGSEDDVLSRYCLAARQFEADTVVRVTSDCPALDPVLLDLTVTSFQTRVPELDYLGHAGYPRGLDVEVFSRAALERSDRECEDPAWREHVTQYILRAPGFRVDHLQAAQDFSRHRWTLDTPADYELLQKLYGHFGHGDFSWREALAVLEARPDWVALNAHVQQKIVP